MKFAKNKKNKNGKKKSVTHKMEQTALHQQLVYIF